MYDNKNIKLNAEDEAYYRIKDAIRQRKILPKRKLVESTLAKIFGMSRTPVRAAIKKLEYEGFIETFPNKGAYLISPTVKEIKDTYDVRIILEKKAIVLAIENLDDKNIQILEKCIENESETYSSGDYETFENINNEFHLKIAEFSNNTILHKYIKDIFGRINRFQLIYDYMDNVSMPVSVNTHIHILNLMKDKKIEEAEKYVELHILGAMDRLNFEEIENNSHNDFLSI